MIAFRKQAEMFVARPSFVLNPSKPDGPVLAPRFEIERHDGPMASRVGWLKRMLRRVRG